MTFPWFHTLIASSKYVFKFAVELALSFVRSIASVIKMGIDGLNTLVVSSPTPSSFGGIAIMNLLNCCLCVFASLGFSYDMCGQTSL